MKNTLNFFSLLLLAGFATSCGGDDEGPSYKFKDQDASGKIDNVA